MKKIILYFISFCFLTVGLALFALSGQHSVPDFEQDGYQLIDLDKGGVLNQLGSNVFFALTNNKLYRVDKYVGDGFYTVINGSIPSDQLVDHSFVIKVLNQDFILNDTLERIHAGKISELLLNEEVIFASKLLQNESEAGLFAAIDDSMFIFFFIGILIFILLWLHDGLVYLINFFVKKDTRRWIEIIQLMGGVWLLQNMFNSPVYPTAVWVEFVRAIIMVVPVYVFYEWVTSKFLKRLDWIDELAAKFVILLVLSFLFFYLANQIVYWIIILTSGKAIFSTTGLPYAMAFAFAFGNLLNHLRRQLFTLQGVKKALEKSQETELESSSQLNALQSSVNPHFLYNALNSISTLATKDPEKTEQMTIALSEFYKYATNRKETNWSTVREELEMVKNYIGIERIRFEDRLEFDIEVDPNVLDFSIPHFILQPIIENAIKYGYDGSMDKISCKVLISNSKDQLMIQISDSGRPFDQNLSKGFGLNNVSKKLELLYPEKHELNFVNNPKRVEIILNLEK